MTWEWPVSYGVVPADPERLGPETRCAKGARGGTGADPGPAHSTITIAPVVLEGHPAPLLVKASKGADLLVVGSRGHGEFAGMLLGSVSEHVVANGGCPVLVYRDESHSKGSK